MNANQGRPQPPDTLVEKLRRRIVGGVHRGQLRAGDRLPSSREVAGELGIDHRAVARAYRQLADQGLVELRPRSGVYLSGGNERCAGDSRLGHTALWLKDVATEAWLRRIPLPDLPALVRRFLVARALRVVCVESATDPLEAIGFELATDFGLDVTRIAIRPDTPDARPGSTLSGATDDLLNAVAHADIIVTTAFHAALVKEAAAPLGTTTPLITATLNPDWRRALRQALTDRGLLVVGVDPRSEERFKIALEIAPGERFRFKTLAEWRADPDPQGAAVHATHAVRQRDREIERIALDAVPQILSMETARELAAVITGLQVQVTE